MRFNLSDTATDMFDQHPLWEDLKGVDEWLKDLSDRFDSAYVGLPGLASEFLCRIEVVASVTRLYLEAAPKEAVSETLLDEIKKMVLEIHLILQSINWDDENDYDQELSDANKAADTLLSLLYGLRNFPADVVGAKRSADKSERERITAFLDNTQNAVDRLKSEEQGLRELLTANKTASKDELAELRQQIEEVATSFEEQIAAGVEAGKKRIDDQITTLQNQYNSEIEKQKERAGSDLRAILESVQAQKDELDELVENTQIVSGYVAEAAMSRMFKNQAKESKDLWIWFTVFGGIVSLASVGFLYFAGEAALETSASSADIVRGVIRAVVGLGAGALAAYLFRQASVQQRSFQDSRSAEVRLGSLDAFLARFDDDEAQEIRRGVGKRVYVDGELGEIARREPDTASNRSKQELREVETPKKTETSSTEE